MAKSSPRKSLKSLFSRSEANLAESAGKDVHKTEGERKKFKFLKLKSKSKNDSGKQQLHSAVGPSNAEEDREAWTDNMPPNNKSSSVYATAPRSKNKELSYSELDLRKPKRFATFSFSGLKKRKKKHEGNFSKSVYGLNVPSLEEETPLDLSQMELDQANMKTKFSMSQPELDTTDKFDIPSPPPVAINQFESNFPFLNKTHQEDVINPKQEVKEPLKNLPDAAEQPKEPQTAPIAAIPELQLDNPDVSVEKENISAPLNSSRSDYSSFPPTASTGTSSAADNQTGPVAAATQPPVLLHTSDHKAALGNSVSVSSDPCDRDLLQPSNTKTEISLTESTTPEFSRLQPDASDADRPYGKPPPASADSKMDATVTDSAPLHPTDNYGLNGSFPEEVSVSERSACKTAKPFCPVNQDKVYGELYESLFPQSFTSEVLSSLSNPPPHIRTQIRPVETTLEPLRVKTLDDDHTENNLYSLLSASYESAVRDTDADAVGDYSHRNKISSIEGSIFTSNQTLTASEHHRDADTQHTSSLYSSSRPADSSNMPYSELTNSLAERKSDSFGLIHDTTRSVSVFQNSAPPISDYVRSQGIDTQVTNSIRRVIIVQESVTDEVSSDAGCPSPVPEEMSKAESLTLDIEPKAPPQDLDGLDGVVSPTYLSVGSDDGSAMEVYYSAEEDNAGSGDEEMFWLDGRQEAFADGPTEVVGLRDEFHQQGEIGESYISRKDEGEISGVIVPGCDAKSPEKEAATEFSQVKEEGQGKRKEELLATPVQQVNTPMVCDFAPPSREDKGEGSEENWAKELETEAHPNGEQQPPSQGIEYLVYKDSRSEFMRAAAGNTKEPITPRSGEAEELVSFTVEADSRGQVSQESTKTKSETATGAVTHSPAEVEPVSGPLAHSTEPQSGATQTENSRDLQSSEWADTITRSTGRMGTVPQQVTVELSTTTTDAHRPQTEAADAYSDSQEPPAGTQTNNIQGSRISSSTHSAEVLTSENQLNKADQESVYTMNLGFSSLNTKLSGKSSSPLSLRSEADPTEDSQDSDSFSKTSAAVSELNGGDPDYRWKNRFEGVSQFKPSRTEDSSSSHRMSDIYFSPSSLSPASPETSPHKYFGNAHSTSISLPPTVWEERITSDNRLSDSSEVHLSREGEAVGEQRHEWRRSLLQQEELTAPAGDRQRQEEREPERIKSRWDTQQLPVSDSSSAQTGPINKEDDDSQFTGVFQATLVELVSDPTAPPSTPPASPDADSVNQFDMDNLVDTLKSMGPSLRPRTTGLIRPPAPALISSLPPIVEDAQSPVTGDTLDGASSTKNEVAGSDPAESQNGFYTLPPDLGLRGSPRDTRSPLELMKQGQQGPLQSGIRGVNSPLRAPAISSTAPRKSDCSFEDLQSQMLNGNGVPQSPGHSSRLDHSVIFGSQTLENKQAHRPLFRASSLPDSGLSTDRLGAKEHEFGAGADPVGSRFERFSFLLSSSSSGSLTGGEDRNNRISRPPQPSINSPPSGNSPTRLLSPTASIDLHRSLATADSPLSVFSQTQGLGMGAGTGRVSAPILQRSLSREGNIGAQQTSLFNSVQGESKFQRQEPEPERNLASKYRAFPDAYLTKEKEHGKLNPRPGKIYIFDRPGMCGQRIEVRGDVIDATPWELQETISIRVVRGGWVLYEKPNFKGEKIALDEGDIELTYPFSPPEEQLQNGHQENNGETGDVQPENQPVRKFIIGSIRRAVRDYSVPDISLFPEENAEGKKVIFRDTSEDARIFGFPIKANSIIINAGLWLVYAHPFFQGVPRVLEVGGYSNPAAWGVESPYVGSLHPLKIGEPRVENTSEPKLVIYDKPYFTGKSRTITANMRDFMTRVDRQQTAFMYSVGSLKVLGGIWVGYEKEGFRGHQYLLEEGEYHDWRVWGGCDSELRSVRVIRAELTDPMMVMFEMPEEEQEGMQEENTFEVTEAIPDVELFEYKTSTRSIHVLSGAWIAYSHVDFSGDQYILEKGFYNNCADWGSQDNRICSVQPILLAHNKSSRMRNEVLLYSEPNLQGECQVFDRNQEEVSEKPLTKSCRVSGGCWAFYEDKLFSGNMFVLSEGDYPNLTSMGCPPDFTIRSIKAVPMTLSVPSISLFGLECLEGREITTEAEILSMIDEGFNNHILSVRVNSGCWVICEHSHYRGRQFLLEPIEITNWQKFSSLETIGSLYPIRQKRHFFRIKNKERGHFLSVQGGVEEMKTGRVVVTPEVENLSDIWFYQDGLFKNKLSPAMSLQVMGNVEPGAKVVLWSETRQPVQVWTAKTRGLITSLTFPGMVLDVKGGKSYDKDHVVVLPENEERPSQQWEIELL